MEFKPRKRVASACLLVVIAAARTGGVQPILGSTDSNRTGARPERYSDGHGNQNGMFSNATPFLWLNLRFLWRLACHCVITVVICAQLICCAIAISSVY